MREIKFRAWWHADKPIYVRGKQTNPDRMLFVGDDSGTDHPLDCCNYARQGQDVILMQYTGLKDKNGKEIYEGDILLIQDTWKERILDDGSGPTEPCNHLAAVDFFNGMFGVFIRETAEIYNTDFWSFERLLNEDDGDLEIIGNIYDNPELLK